jgi:hypothetical protein
VDLRQNSTRRCPVPHHVRSTPEGTVMGAVREPTQQEIEWAIERMEAPLIDVDPDELMDLDEHERDEIEIANFMMTNRSL